MKKTKHMLTKRGYNRLVTKAKEFMHALMGDSGYSSPSSNRIALESMLIGWIRSTPEWAAYDKFCRCHCSRTDVYLVAQDLAVQAAHDAIWAEPGEFVTWFYTGMELSAVCGPTAGKTLLRAKIEKAKKRLRIANFIRQADGFTATISA